MISACIAICQSMQCRCQAAEPHFGGVAKCMQDSRQRVRKTAYEALKSHIEARRHAVAAAVEAIGTHDPDGFARKLLAEISQVGDTMAQTSGATGEEPKT
mmetsp:Transcript_154978/g.495602  ORF Transcript_154978/g.495602 Transcript_154978/m.495602 type:complete len:100 (-) Transcript_154978:177-476(-)